MAEYDDWVILDKQKQEKKEDYWTIVDKKEEQGNVSLSLLNVKKSSLEPERVRKIREKKRLKAGVNPGPLQADPQIVPLVKQQQQKRQKPFNKTGFLKDVKALNKRAREADTVRLSEKKTLRTNVYAIMTMLVKENENENVRGLPADIMEVLKTVEAYTLLDVVGKNAFSGKRNRNNVDDGTSYVRGRVREEYLALRNVNQSLMAVIKKYSQRSGYKSVVDNLKNLRKSLYIQAGLMPGSFKTRIARMKAKWNHFKEEDKQIDGTNKNIQLTADSNKEKTKETDIQDRKDWPLFAHRPTHEDIHQGNAGNCYFLAALASLTAEEIRDMMLDNGDGTVTVRFFQMNMEKKQYDPVYVTVDKVVNIRSCEDYLWVQVMEKAYAKFVQHKMNNMMHFNERTETDEENHVRLAKDKEIKEDTIDLGFVGNGGQAYKVLGALLGKEEQVTYVYRGSAEKSHAQILKDALLYGDAKGPAILQIRSLEARMEHLRDSTNTTLKAKGMHIDDVKTAKIEINQKKDTIIALEEAMQNATDPALKAKYKTKLEDQQNRLKEQENEVAPYLRILNVF